MRIVGSVARHQGQAWGEGRKPVQTQPDPATGFRCIQCLPSRPSGKIPDRVAVTLGLHFFPSRGPATRTRQDCARHPGLVSEGSRAQRALLEPSLQQSRSSSAPYSLPASGHWASCHLPASHSGQWGKEVKEEAEGSLPEGGRVVSGRGRGASEANQRANASFGPHDPVGRSWCAHFTDK